MQRLPSGARLDLFDRIDSTSAEAKRRAAAGETGPLWILAREQTSGYGRRGRPWESRFGDFAGTFLFRPDRDPATFAQLSFVAGLAVYHALSDYADENVLALKWPNDVLLAGKKIAGLLLERIESESGPLVSVGVGVNIVSAPAGTPYPTARLIDRLRTGRAVPEPADLAVAIDREWGAAYTVWAREDFSVTRDKWLRVAKGVGEAIRVNLPGETLEGVFDGVDETGALILRQGDARRIITAGEIMFGD